MNDATPSKRIQFRAGPVAAQLGQRTANDLALSADLVARRDLHRYYMLLADELRTLDLTHDEARLCCDALSGQLADADDVLRSPGWLLAWILDAIARDQLDAKWDVDASHLTRKIAQWSAGQRHAAADAVERCWLLTNGGLVDVDTALVQVGLLRPRTPEAP